MSLGAVLRVTDDQPHDRFQSIRLADNGGAPFCPRCYGQNLYAYEIRKASKCRPCQYHFTVTSGTFFASRKLAIADHFAVIAIFVNAVKGVSALQLGRDLDVQSNTAFIMAHRLREALSAEQIAGTLPGVVEVDRCYVGGHTKLANFKAERADRRLVVPAKGQSVVVARKRGDRTVPFVAAKESDDVALVRQLITMGSTVHADEAGDWGALHAHFEMRRINYSVAFSKDGACTNQAESFFSRLRRAEIGQHHYVSGEYLPYYAAEMA